MGSQTLPRQRNLCHFLLNLLEGQEVHGLEWVSREGKLFKVPWIDKRNKGNTQSDILKKWEIYNGRYQDGKSENWADWKQVFRGALNKSPYVMAVPDMHQLKDTSFPYKVYQFTGDVNIDKPDSPLETRKRKKSPNGKIKQSSSPHSESNSDLNELQLNDLGQYDNVPKVVLEELRFNNISPNSNYQACPPIEPALVSPSNLSESPKECDMDIFDDLILKSPTQPCESGNNYSAVVNPEDIQCNASQQTLVGHFNPTPAPVFNYWSQDVPVMQFQAYYLNKQVSKGFMGNKGVCFFSGSPLIEQINSCNLDPSVQAKIRGPNYFEKVELPDIMKCPHIMENCDFDNLTHIQNILKNLTRGVLLYSSGRNLFAYRLCKTRVFVSYGKGQNLVLERKHKSEQKIFDMDQFEHQLKSHIIDPQSVACPSPLVFLTFGRELSHGTQTLVHLELTVLEAERTLRREMQERQDVQISCGDSVDMMLDMFKETVTLNSSAVCF